MSDIERNLALEEYRLFLVSAQSSGLLAFWERPCWRLPRISIPTWTRPAEQLQQAIRDTFGLHIIVLDFLATRCHDARCVVAEVYSGQAPDHLRTVPWEHIGAVDLNPQEKEALRSILAGECGPFLRLGWVEEAIEWVQSAIPGPRVEPYGIRQYNAGGRFALLRFAMRDGHACWLKATGVPNRHEFNVTCLLAGICPEALPRLVASRRDWNAWLMKDAGRPIEGQARLPLLMQAVTALAALQKACLTRCSELFEAGACDLRLGSLRSSLPDLIEYLSLAMEHQTSTRVPRLTTGRLVEIGELLKNACNYLEDLSIPDTLVHNDVNPSNILYDGSRCVFADWSEACIGNPFITFQHLLMMSYCGGGMERTTLDRFKETYCQCWLDILSPWKIDITFALMPLLAPFAYLYGRGSWLHSAHRENSYVQGYARSLARYIDRAARSASVIEALCH